MIPADLADRVRALGREMPGALAVFDADGTLWRDDVGEAFLRHLVSLGWVRLPDGSDPYEAYAYARLTTPAARVQHLGADVAMVYRFAEAEQVLGDSETFSSRINGKWMRPFLGRTILAGTDQVVPGHSLARELELLVQAGLTPLEAIRCATITPAQVLGVSAEVGTIEVGKRADLVILDADPSEDVRNIRRVHWTVSRGRVFVPAELWPAIDFRAPSLHGPRN